MEAKLLNLELMLSGTVWFFSISSEYQRILAIWRGSHPRITHIQNVHVAISESSFSANDTTEPSVTLWRRIRKYEKSMPTLNTAVLVGSLRKESINLKLARAVEKLASDQLKFHYIQIGDLPLYTQDFDTAYPPICQQLKKDIESADAVLFVTPEYNRSIPGVLKNAIDIASRPYGTNSFAGKPGAVLGASPGAPGTSMAQQHLRNILAYLDVPTLGQPEVFIQFKENLIDAEGNITNEGTKKFLQGFVERYVAWIKRFHR
jgi:chromate reductase, NAD(P)H dehydrogenase (quinone)